MSAQSMALDCDRKRFSRSAFSDACICTVKPRSLLACSAMAGIAVTGGPAWCSTMSLMFCAQMVGKPVIAPDPIAAPVTAAVVFSSALRETPFDPWLVVPDVMTLYPRLECGTKSRRTITRSMARCNAAWSIHAHKFCFPKDITQLLGDMALFYSIYD